MLKQRIRAAVVVAYDRSAASLAQKRAFERQRMFQKIIRDGARRWERDFPSLLEKELDKKREWLRKEPEGKMLFETHVTYTLSVVELTVPTEAPTSGTSEARGGGALGKHAEDAVPGFDEFGVLEAVGADAAMRAAANLRKLEHKRDASGGEIAHEDSGGFAMPISNVERLDDHGLDSKDRWQLVFRFGDLCRAWVKQDTGEEIGPASNKVGLTRINRKLAERIALENWEGRQAVEIARELDSEKQKRYEQSLKSAYASVIQRWFRAYRRV